MSNGFFDTADWVRLIAQTLARSELVNAIIDAIQAAFDKLPSESRLKEGRVTYLGISAGSANVITATAPYTMTLTDGLHVRFKVATSNTAAATINISAPSALGAIAIVDYGGNALTGGELAAGTFADLVYSQSGAHFRIINPTVDVAVVTVNNLAVVSGTDTTPSNLSTKIEGVGRIAERITSSGSNERLQLKEKNSGHLAATGTIHIGGMQTVSTASGAITIYCPANGAGDLALQDGDTWELFDIGGAVESNNASINGNGKNIKFMSQSAAATLDWVGPNYSRLRGIYSLADDRWNVTGV
jgi:hypothetical protein